MAPATLSTACSAGLSEPLLPIYWRKLERCGRYKQPNVFTLAQALCVCLPDIKEGPLQGAFFLFVPYLMMR